MADGCSPGKDQHNSYGAKINDKGSVSVAELMNTVSEEEKPFKVKGKIKEVCQMKGCWITLENEQGVTIRVTFKDYGFFVPKDISGREVIVDGVALKELIDEDAARHFAEDGRVEIQSHLWLRAFLLLKINCINSCPSAS